MINYAINLRKKQQQLKILIDLDLDAEKHTPFEYVRKDLGYVYR